MAFKTTKQAEGLAEDTQTATAVMDMPEEGDDVSIVEPEDIQESRFRIVIDEQETADNNADVFIGVNGNTWSIKRGYEVTVPESVVKNIQSCIYELTEKDEQGNDRIRRIPRFALRVIGAAD